MRKTALIGAGVLASVLFAGTALAQTTGVQVQTTPVNSPVSGGGTAVLGTLSVTGPSGSTLTSLPLTFTPGGGAANTSLSNCQIYNASGQSLTTGSNTVGTIGTGASTFTLNSPLALSGTPTTLTVRCDIGVNNPAAGTFVLSSGTPSSGTIGTSTPATSTPVTSGPFTVMLDTAPSVPRGSQDVALATIELRAATSTSVRVTALPLTVQAASGAAVTSLNDCRIRTASNSDSSLTGGVDLLTSGSIIFTPTTPIVLAAGQSQTLSLTCDVESTAPVGGSISLSITPSAIQATNVSGGATLSGVPSGATSGTVLISAESAGGGTGGDSGGTPDVPDTGFGGSMLMILALAGIVSLLGLAYMQRRTI